MKDKKRKGSIVNYRSFAITSPDSLLGLKPCPPSYVAWRAGTVTPLSGLSWVRCVKNSHYCVQISSQKWSYRTLRRRQHDTRNKILWSTLQELHGHNSTISTFMCLWAIYIFLQSICLFCWRKYVDKSWKYINRSQTHECGNLYWDRAIFWKGIHKRDFRFSALAAVKMIMSF